MGAAKIKAQESSGGRSLEFNSIQGRRRHRLRSRGRRKQARRVDSGLDRTSRRQAQKGTKQKAPRKELSAQSLRTVGAEEGILSDASAKSQTLLLGGHVRGRKGVRPKKKTHGPTVGKRLRI